jgi:ATP-dependent RNA helicase DeaD
MITFESFHLSKSIISLLLKHNITEPTPIQQKLIPLITAGRDVIAQSETGSGKTLSFALPIIDKIKQKDRISTLVLAPTRELTFQIAQEFVKYSHGKNIVITPIYGGVSINEQIKKLNRTNIIVGTPGRLLDLIQRNILHLQTIQYLVFDEADRMLDMGFITDIERILRYIPKERQTLLLSATLPKEIIRVSQKYLNNPATVQFESPLKPEILRQTYYQTNPDQRLALLIHLLKSERDLALIFCNRKHITAKLARKLSHNGVDAKCLHGDMSQNKRERVTSAFKGKKFNVLIATDVAARGLHIDDISHVYNYEIPRDVDSYTHRVGRTARAGKKGEAISLIATPEERQFFKQILFNYNGNITLKTVDAADLPRLTDLPKQSTNIPHNRGRRYGKHRHQLVRHTNR